MLSSLFWTSSRSVDFIASVTPSLDKLYSIQLAYFPYLLLLVAMILMKTCSSKLFSSRTHYHRFRANSFSALMIIDFQAYIGYHRLFWPIVSHSWFDFGVIDHNHFKDYMYIGVPYDSILEANMFHFLFVIRVLGLVNQLHWRLLLSHDGCGDLCSVSRGFGLRRRTSVELAFPYSWLLFL